MSSSSDPPHTGNTPERPSDVAHWAPLIDKLRVSGLAEEALNLNVEGRRAVGPLQGFGKLWKKTYRVRLIGSPATPPDVVKTWKDNFAGFWPAGNRFYTSITGIAPGEVAVLNLSAGPMKLSTGVLVVYADDESFTFMTPQGHPFAAFITFSAFEEEGCTVAETQVFIRANDPLWEIVMRVKGYEMEDRFWQQTLSSLAAHFDVESQPQMQMTCLDPRLQWSEAKNIWHNAAIRSALYTLAAPARWMARPFRRGRH